MARQLLHGSRGVTLQMASPPFVQPAGVIPKPQWPEIRKQAKGETMLERKISFHYLRASTDFNKTEGLVSPPSSPGLPAEWTHTDQ